mgnify:CR=1 FL=1
MQIPAYWARALVDDSGRELDQDDGFGFYGIGWSDTSQADARDMALKRARRIAERFNSNDDMFSLREQYYADRPLREPVVDEMQIDGKRAAVITQNVYGAYVMNTASAMFIDIDVPPPPPVPGLIGRLFGMKPPTQEDKQPPEARIQNTIASQQGLGMKVYRTPAGFRGLVTSRPMQPNSDEAQRLMRAFDSDPLYVTLCRSQQSFRARLTPKPWRIGMDNPPRSFPFFDSGKQAAFDQWKKVYDSRSTGYAACEPLSDEPWGNAVVHPEIAPVLAMHDELACSPGKPLA